MLILMFAIISSDDPKLVALCATCEVQGRKSVIAKVRGEQLVVPMGVRGSTAWPVLSDPRAAIAADPALRDPKVVRAHSKAVKEGRATPHPGVTITERPRTRWVELGVKRSKVHCRFGHPTQIEKSRLLAMSASRATVVLSSRGHAV